jgi:predicted Fe-S protein YdhL (DUF1289 family)
MPSIHISDIEAAINFWRSRSADAASPVLSAPLQALASVYAQMVFDQRQWVDETLVTGAAHEAWLAWYDSTPDTPCIAICSTSQGDAVCAGCGRTFAEVQRWPEMSPVAKRLTWHRITLEGTAWRFNRYAERARG